MLKQIERMNSGVWSGHSRLLQVLTHVIGGIGLGMLMSPRPYGDGKPLGYSLVLLSTALHVYAAAVKPPVETPAGRLRRLADTAIDGRPTRAVGRRLKALAQAAMR
jgi:uncharacterized membrane protein